MKIELNITMDGDHVCVLYGKNIQEGVAGFGKTVSTALNDFSKSWKKAVRKVPTATRTFIQPPKYDNCSIGNIENWPCQWAEKGQCPEKCKHYDGP